MFAGPGRFNVRVQSEDVRLLQNPRNGIRRSSDILAASQKLRNRFGENAKGLIHLAHLFVHCQHLLPCRLCHGGNPTGGLSDRERDFGDMTDTRRQLFNGFGAFFGSGVLLFTGGRDVLHRRNDLIKLFPIRLEAFMQIANLVIDLG
ncbi:hypothetical protein D3C74_279760 [compost metagenome]